MSSKKRERINGSSGSVLVELDNSDGVMKVVRIELNDDEIKRRWDKIFDQEEKHKDVFMSHLNKTDPELHERVNKYVNESNNI